MQLISFASSLGRDVLPQGTLRTKRKHVVGSIYCVKYMPEMNICQIAIAGSCGAP